MEQVKQVMNQNPVIVDGIKNILLKYDLNLIINQSRFSDDVDFHLECDGEWGVDYQNLKELCDKNIILNTKLCSNDKRMLNDLVVDLGL